MSRSLKIIVTISLLLNAILLSAGGVAYYKKLQLKSDNAVLSSEARSKIKNAVNIDKREALKKMRALRVKTNELKDIVEAKNFDSEKYNAAMSGLLDIKDKMARERAEKMGAAMTNLSIEERKKLSKALTRSLVKSPRKRFDRGQRSESGRFQMQER